MTTTQQRREPTLLFVGETSFKSSEIFSNVGDEPINITVVKNGQQAIQWLTNNSESRGEKQPPDIIVLTAGLESMAWPTLLHALKSSPRLQTVPVVVLTSKEVDADVAYASGGNAHVSAPESPAAYRRCLSAICEFWLTWNTLQNTHVNWDE